MNPEAKQYDQRLGAEAIGIVLADQFEPIVLAALPPAMRSLLELLAAGEVGRGRGCQRPPLAGCRASALPLRDDDVSRQPPIYDPGYHRIMNRAGFAGGRFV